MWTLNLWYWFSSFNSNLYMACCVTVSVLEHLFYLYVYVNVYSCRLGVYVCCMIRVFFLIFYILKRGEQGRKRRRETSMCKINTDWLPLAYPNQGPGPQPRHVPWSGIKPITFGPQVTPNPTEPHQSGLCCVFKKIISFGYLRACDI